MRRRTFSTLAGLIVLMLACNFAAGAVAEVTATPVPPSAPPDSPTATTAPEPPASTDTPPAAVSETPITLPGPDITYGNVRFTLPPAIASGVTAMQVPAQADAENLPYWEIYPDYLDFTLENYVLADTFHMPRIVAYPAAEYEALNETAGAQISGLRQMLADRPAAPENIPFLPPFNAAQVFHAQLAYLDFQNGSGVRFVTQYAQSFSPVNNHEMFYTFQGLTSDGGYYVAAVLPASAAILPASFDDATNPPEGGVAFPDFDAADFDPQFPQYMADITQALNDLPADAFAPSLTALDQLAASLQIE